MISSFITSSLLALVTAAAPITDLHGVKTLRPVGSAEKKTEMKAIGYQSEITPRPLQSPQQKASVSRDEELAIEDFNNVPDGDTELVGNWTDPRYTTLIASRDVAPGSYLDTESGTWEGNHVYAGKNGSIVLQTYSPYENAFINTPLADYSGDITVKVRCRWSRAFYARSENTEVDGYFSTTGSTLECLVKHGGYDSEDNCKTDIQGSILESGRLYQQNGWVVLTYTFRNMSAYADSYITLRTSAAVEIDWIEVTDAATYLAAPANLRVTDFKSNQFSIAWDRVRRSFNYYVDLYKQVYTGDAINIIYDFEDGTLPEGNDHLDVADGVGCDGSKGVTLNSNSSEFALTTPSYDMNLEEITFNAIFNVENEDTYDYTQYGYGAIMVEGLSEDGSWVLLAVVACDDWWVEHGKYNLFTMDKEVLAGGYKSIRVYAEGMGEGTTVTIDNLHVYTPRPYVLVNCKDNPSNLPEDSRSLYWAMTDYCEYTFTDLDPETEYWYAVRSHNLDDFTKSDKIHALGVASPELLPATNITSTSYTANWIDVPKAQSYIVRNNKMALVAEDDDEYIIMEENFSNCTGGGDYYSLEPIGNESEITLDAYTDNSGWTGLYNAQGQNMLGTVMGSYGHLISPVLPVNPERGSYTIYLEVEGYPGDYLYLIFIEQGTEVYCPFDENGYVAGTIEIPAEMVRPGERIMFISAYDLGFGISAFEIWQAVKAGDTLLYAAGSQEVATGVQSATFDNLDSAYSYAYTVTSKFGLEKEAAFSMGNDFMTVNLSGTTAIPSTVDAIRSGIEEMERFDISGKRVDKDYKGFVIKRMSDGSARKAIVK